MGAGASSAAQAVLMDPVRMQRECNIKNASLLGPPGFKAAIDMRVSTRSTDKLPSIQTPDTPSTSLGMPDAICMLEEKFDCERCPDHTPFQNTARHILRSLGRGWVTPDHVSSWMSLGIPDSEKNRSELPKLNRGWMTPDTPASGLVNAQDLETALQEAMMSTRQSCPEVGAEDKFSAPCNASGHSAATSSDNWHTPAETLIIFDWDDTLLPTSWLSNRNSDGVWCKSQLQASDLAELDRLDQVARSLVIAASALGRICCVTLSKRPWQTTTMHEYMPHLAQVWKDLDIQVLYATDEIIAPRCCFPSLPVAHVIHDDDETMQIIHQSRVLAKKRAMEKCMKKFYGNCSWKNVVSSVSAMGTPNGMR
eukprot:TRINITY_DN74415_c0_g1_i1.p1 TRINITY_DN74415_c0_g1~~TRINITY_DN74415_c0_g1_i1.p1  ORF type:complete len:366 (-),score=52.50 TRINITY_DN74415_c0_g1_i1:287-1384(-)